MPPTPRFAYVGCRTTRERNARGDGIVVYRLSEGGGSWHEVQCVRPLLNPSFLSFDRTGRMLYVVHGDSSEISAFHVDPRDGRLGLVNQTSTHGKNPVHLSVDPTNDFVIVANHVESGRHVPNIAVLALGPDGALGDLVDQVPLKGTVGPHRVEQPFAKPHQVQFDPTGRFIAVPDKGLDQVDTFQLDRLGKLHRVEGLPAKTREGAGPRHVTFHPKLPYAFVLNELSSTVMACRFDVEAGSLVPYQELSALPDTFIGFNRAAEIDISADGRFIYASNRGHDSVAVFAVDPSSGRMHAQDWTSASGNTPRFFALEPNGDHLVVANEDSDTIVRFARDAETGALSAAATVARTGSPTCVVFA